jgi:DhnA family fructose-bisphosphate aldolase class Ia
MDDRYTAYDIEGIVRDGLDFAKNLIRINLEDSGSLDTLETTSLAVSDAVNAKIPIMLEPFMSSWKEGKVVNDLSTESVILSVAIASGLGNSSSYTWLKLPVVQDMDKVMASTTLPTLLLGGDPNGNPEETYASWAEALKLPGVRGLVVGRSLLYPADNDVVAAIDTAAALVHGS